MLNCLSDSAVAVAVAAADVDAENGRSEAEAAAPLRGGVLGGLPTAPFLALLRVLTIFKLGEGGGPPGEKSETELSRWRRRSLLGGWFALLWRLSLGGDE